MTWTFVCLFFPSSFKAALLYENYLTFKGKGSKASSGSSEAVLVCRQYTELSWTTKVLPTHIWKEGVLNFISVLKYATALAVFQHQHSHVCVRASLLSWECSRLWLCRIPVIVEQVSTRKTAPRDSPRTSLKHEQSFLHFGGKTTPCTVPFKQQSFLF